MKKKIVSIWRHCLPVLLLALILAVMPLTMAAPACAADSVLDSDSRPYYYFTTPDDGDPLSIIVYPPDGYSGAPCVALFIPTSQGIDLWFYSGIGLVLQDDRYLVAEAIGAKFIARSVDISDDNVVTFDDLYFDSYFDSVDLLESNSLPIFYDMGNHEYEFTLINGNVSVLSVFSGVGSWLSGVVQNISTMFWTAESGMTVIGYLAVASLALAVILLIFYLIAGWLKFH